MKIALICTEKLPVPPIAGGAVQLYIEGILPILSKYHDITVFGVDHPDLKNEEVLNNVTYIRVPAKDRIEYVRNIKLKLTKDFDLIHVFNRPRFVMSFSKDLPDTKFSLSLHNEMFESEKIPIKMALDCISKVEFITTVSKFIANGVNKLYPESLNKTFPVYSGVDTDIYKPVMSEEGARIKERLKKKYGIEDKKVVIFVGRLSVKKGVDKLILAMKKIMELQDNVALVIIGSKWYGKNSADEYTESILELSKKLNGPIIFTGFLPPSEVPELYNLGDVFVCPSQWNEPLARVHYEAMAAGLPIVTTNRGGNSEVIEGYGNGIVIDDYTNVNAFADEIIELLNNSPKAIEMGQKGRKLAEKNFTWTRVANDLLKLFNGVEEKMLNENQTEHIKPLDEQKDESSIEFVEEIKDELKPKIEKKLSDTKTLKLINESIEETIEKLVEESIDEPVEDIIEKVMKLSKFKEVDFSKFKPIEYEVEKPLEVEDFKKTSEIKKYKQPELISIYTSKEKNIEEEIDNTLIIPVKKPVEKIQDKFIINPMVKAMEESEDASEDMLKEKVIVNSNEKPSEKPSDKGVNKSVTVESTDSKIPNKTSDIQSLTNQEAYYAKLFGDYLD